MHKRMTITLDEVVYEGLYRTVGKRRMSQFIEDLLNVQIEIAKHHDGMEPHICNFIDKIVFIVFIGCYLKLFCSNHSFKAFFTNFF